MNLLQSLKVKIEKLKLDDLIHRIEYFKNTSLVVDIFYKEICIGIDIYLDNGGKIEIFPRNELANFYLTDLFHSSFLSEKRITIYLNGELNKKIDIYKYQKEVGENNIESIFKVFCEFLRFDIDGYIKLKHSLFYSSNINNNLIELKANLNRNYEADTLIDITHFFRSKIMSMEQTIDKIINQQLSLARFGDGELKLISQNDGGIYYQENSYLLASKLRSILQNPIDGLLVGIPPLLFENKFWRSFWSLYWPIIGYNFNLSVYANSMITRPEFFKTYGHSGFDLWSKVWDKANISLVYGLNGRFDPNHPIFANAKSITCIESLPVNAFQDLDRITSLITKSPKKDLYLIALGPAGTILASELHQAGFRALDIGHLNNSYDHILRGLDKPEAIVFK